MEEISVIAFRAYFGRLFSDAERYPDAVVESRLEDAKVEVAPCVFKKYYKRALFYLTAHFLTIFTQQQDALEIDGTGASAAEARGVVNSVSVGDLSLSQEMPEYSSSSDDKFLASTIYGQEFIRLRNKMGRGSLLARVPVAGGDCGCVGF